MKPLDPRVHKAEKERAIEQPTSLARARDLVERVFAHDVDHVERHVHQVGQPDGAPRRFALQLSKTTTTGFQGFREGFRHACHGFGRSGLWLFKRLRICTLELQL